MADEVSRLFEELERQLRETVGRLRNSVEGHSDRTRASAAPGALEALQTLKRMRELDLINDEDYEQKKSEILARL